jgi:SCY1-like protein 2
MDVLNRLRSTVSNTVSELLVVLPGNPVTREFEATCHIASAGPGSVSFIFSVAW